MTKTKGTPSKTHEEMIVPSGAIPHEQFPQEQIREQRLFEGEMYLHPEVARIEMTCTQEQNVIGNNLASARERAGYTQQQIANTLGVSDRTIRKYESGESVPNVLHLRLLSIIYGVSSDRILGLIGKDADELLEYYDFATPQQRKNILGMARMIQEGREDYTAGWALADDIEWINGSESRMRRLVQDLISRWGREETESWINASEDRNEQLGHFLNDS